MPKAMAALALATVALPGCVWLLHGSARRSGSGLDSPSAYAWRLFAKVNEPVEGAAQRWEQWPSSGEVYSTSPLLAPGASASPIRAMFKSAEVAARDDVAKPFGVCGTWDRDTTIHMNLVAAHYIRDNGLVSNRGLVAHAGAGIFLPVGSVATKQGWLAGPADPSQYWVPNLNLDQHTGSRPGWGLGGMHLMAKTEGGWFFATFESTCVQRVQAGTVMVSPPQPDTFGYPDGLHPSPALRALFERHHLDPVWCNYRLAGTQSNFYDPRGASIELGNRVIEAGAQGPSCKGCHARAGACVEGSVVFFPQGSTVAPPVASDMVPGIRLDFMWSFKEVGGPGLRAATRPGRLPPHVPACPGHPKPGN